VRPTVGRIVHFRLNEHDVSAIECRREHDRRERGNPVQIGEVCAAVVVRAFHDGSVNLQVLLDGDGVYWVTSRKQTLHAEVPQLGEWCWPPREERFVGHLTGVKGCR
jgi:hypothetical protein